MRTKNDDLTRSAGLGADPAPQHAATVVVHTPGPWFVTLAAGGTGRPQIVRAVDSRVQDIVCQRGGALTPENARLIAAAPELLAALKELIDAGQFAVDSCDDIAIMLRLGQATDNARAVIAKAEGR